MSHLNLNIISVIFNIVPGITARALFDYQAADTDEISFNKDDIIIKIERVKQAWWRGTNPQGKRGLFPSNNVELEGDLKVCHSSSDIDFKIKQ